MALNVCALYTRLVEFDCVKRSAMAAGNVQRRDLPAAKMLLGTYCFVVEDRATAKVRHLMLRAAAVMPPWLNHDVLAASLECHTSLFTHQVDQSVACNQVIRRCASRHCSGRSRRKLLPESCSRPKPWRQQASLPSSWARQW